MNQGSYHGNQYTVTKRTTYKGHAQDYIQWLSELPMTETNRKYIVICKNMIHCTK